MVSRSLPFFCCLALVHVGGWAQGHDSHQGYLPERLGTVNFQTSCNEQARPLISKGVALLHSFGYEEARVAFKAAAGVDLSCAMAQWGIARSWYHPIWAPPSPSELAEGATAISLALAKPANTKRERDYIRALAVFYENWQTVDNATRARAYEQALARVSEMYPKDDEAAIFYALQLVAIGYLDPADHSYAWQKRGAVILNRLLPRHPAHPGIAHYIIHAIDYPSTAELGLKAARAYAAIAPDSAHALHMPSHIFTRLGLWDDSVASNLASAKAAVAQAKRLHGGGGAFDQLHALDYLIYAYLQQARDRSALGALSEMAAITSLDENQFAAAYAFAASPARYALERHDWKAAAQLEVKPGWFPWSRFRNAEALVHYAKAIGAARSGDVPAARRIAAELAAMRESLPAARDYDWSGSMTVQAEAVAALILFAEGHQPEALIALRKAADHEDVIDKHPVTPGPLLPVREMLADLLLETGSAAAALKEYETVLTTAPGRFNATAGAAKAAEAAGKTAKACAFAAQLLTLAGKAEGRRPEIVWARTYVSRREFPR